MAEAWIRNGPVSLPPRWLAYSAGAVVVAFAILGVALGMRAAWHDSGAPDLGSAADGAADQGVLTAKPIVETPPPVMPSENTVAKGDAADADQAKADALAAKEAAAQEIQAKPSKPAGDIDDILASPTEKPPAAVKPATDEAPPPVKTDVPF
jgi:hypothetical protein